MDIEGFISRDYHCHEGRVIDYRSPRVSSLLPITPNNIFSFSFLTDYQYAGFDYTFAISSTLVIAIILFPTMVSRITIP